MINANVSDIPSISPSDLIETLGIVDLIDKPLMIWGSPGIGKSTLVRQYAQKIGGSLIDIRLSQYDAVDLRGLPDVRTVSNHPHKKPHAAFTVWNPPFTLPIEGNPAFADDQKIILFLDEMLQADASVQAVAFQLVLERRIGEHRLRDNVRIIAASNREEDQAGGARMLAPLANRFMHVELMTDSNSWLTWARANGIHEVLVSFLEYRPDLLSGSDKAGRGQAKAFPTPRSWETVSSLLRLADDESTVKPELLENLVAGLVGRGPAAELLAFFDVATDDMQLDRIFESPSSCPVPTEPSRMFATVTALLRTVDDKNAMPVTRYVRRLPIEYQMKFLTDLTLANAYLIVRTPALMDFQLTLIDETREAA